MPRAVKSVRVWSDVTHSRIRLLGYRSNSPAFCIDLIFLCRRVYVSSIIGYLDFEFVQRIRKSKRAYRGNCGFNKISCNSQTVQNSRKQFKFQITLLHTYVYEIKEERYNEFNRDIAPQTTKLLGTFLFFSWLQI